MACVDCNYIDITGKAVVVDFFYLCKIQSSSLYILLYRVSALGRLLLTNIMVYNTALLDLH